MEGNFWWVLLIELFGWVRMIIGDHGSWLHSRDELEVILVATMLLVQIDWRHLYLIRLSSIPFVTNLRNLLVHCLRSRLIYQHILSYIILYFYPLSFFLLLLPSRTSLLILFLLTSWIHHFFCSFLVLPFPLTLSYFF